MLYAPCILFLAEWYVRRRGLANGILFAGTSLGGSFFPIVLPRLIGSYGTSVTLRILSVGVLIIVSPLLPFMKGRLPNVRVAHGPAPRGTHRALRNFPFAFSFSDINRIDSIQTETGSSLFSRLLLGHFSDSANIWMLALGCLSLTCLATFILWGVLACTFARLLIFSVAYGLVACAWPCLWTGFTKAAVSESSMGDLIDL
jgi:MFS transporter, MCT family, solute carrier family 16 (monocarboxylic acid transporters), member 10